MNYTVEELYENLEEKLLNIGIGKQFNKNPAYPVILNKIRSSISQMNMGYYIDKVKVKEEENRISFQWSENDGGKYSFSIISMDDNTFRFMSVEEKSPYRGTDHYVMETNVVENRVHIDNGFITVCENVALIDNKDCDSNSFNNTTWAERSYYTPEGIMRDRERKSYQTYSLPNQVLDPELVLGIPRGAFDYGMQGNNYETKTIMVRDMLDTARLSHEDNKNGIRYQVIAPLSQEHGLQNMELALGDEFLPEKIVIPQLMPQEVEMMIQKEKNSKVQEGLRKFAIGRENYSYNSMEDRNFVRNGVQQVEGRNR